jgi:cobalt/nickel transport system permease protein
MINEPFAIGHSFIHRIDPRYRVAFAILYSVMVAVSYRLPTLTLALMASLALIVLARLNILRVLGHLAVVMGFILFLWLVLPLTYEGPLLTRIGALKISRPGVLLSLQVTLKSFAILGSLIALIATMSIAVCGHALGRMGVPDKIVHLTLITYRYIFVIEQEYQRLLKAIKIRGFQPGTNLHTYRTYAYLIGMLFVRAAARAQRVNQAMRCRGFKGKFYSLQSFPPSAANQQFAILLSAILLILIGLEWAI